MSEKSAREIYAEILKEGEKNKEFDTGNPEGTVTAAHGVREDLTSAEKAFMTRKGLEKSSRGTPLTNRIESRKNK